MQEWHKKTQKNTQERGGDVLTTWEIPQQPELIAA